MQIDPQIAAVHWHRAAVDQVTHDLTARGYQVSHDVAIGDQKAELVARRPGETIVYVFKTGKWSEERAKHAAALRKTAVDTLGAQFRLVLVRPPQHGKVEFFGIDGQLKSLLRENVPAELAALATGVVIERVYEVQLARIELAPSGWRVAGEAVVDVRLRGLDGEEDAEEGATFPFEFDVILPHDGGLGRAETINIDLSGW